MSEAKYIPGYGASTGPLTFVGEAPGAQEDASGIPFVGESGKYLDRVLREVSSEVLGYEVRLDDCYRTNVVKYRPPNNDLKRLSEIGHSIEEGIPQLWQELGDIKSNCIVPVGNLSLATVTGKGTGHSGILQWRGSILPTLHLNRKAVPTLHPAALLRAMSGKESSGSKGGMNPRFKYVFRMDLARALEESKDARYDVPTPHLEIIRDHVALDRFIEKYKHQEVCTTDIEVIKAVPVCCGFAFNDYHGVSIPLIDVYKFQDRGQPGIADSELARLWQGVAWLLQHKKNVGQNFKFDHQALEHICKMPVNFHADIMIMAHNLYCEWEKKLAFHQSLWTRFPFHKDDGKHFNIKKEDIRQFLIYNARDCVVEYALYEEFTKQSKELNIPGFPDWYQEFVLGYTMNLHDFYRRLENVGLKCNKGIQKELIIRYGQKLKEVHTEMDSITGGGFNYNSHPQVRKILFGLFKLPERESTDEDSLVAIGANNCKNPTHKRFIDLLLDYRRIRKALGTYFVAESDFDGRFRTNYRICGTETGRSSTGILKPPTRPKKIGLAFQTLTKHGEFGPEVREEFEADEGYVLVETDMSQAEARIVALLGNDTKTLDLFARGEDIHSLTAKWIFGLSEEPAVIKVRYPDLRFIGKTTRHAGNYDMQKKRLMQIVNTDAKKFHINISISEWKAGQVLQAFHNFSPQIRGEGGFHKSVQQALIDNNRVLVNPFGRYRQFFGPEGHDLHKEAYAHIPQSTVPDALRKAGMRVEQRLREMNLYEKMTEYESIFCIEAHDALYAHIRIEYKDLYLQMMHEEIERPIDFSRCTIPRGTLVIPAESKFGMSLKECKVKGCKGCKYLHEYKFTSKIAA
jgi:uracil-DNA glycosylase family 4